MADADRGGVKSGPIFKDIRRYYCEYCGICRSKRSIILVHIEELHKDEVDVVKAQFGEGEGKRIDNRCDECGAVFRKPAYLKQHMQSHSIEVGGPPEKTCQGSLCHAYEFERPFRCPLEDCAASYRRKDHLTRHSIQHKGKLFTCPVEDCKKSFAYQGNIVRHVKQFHEGASSLPKRNDCEKKHACSEDGCGKVFKYASQLRKHEDSHVKLESVEAFCCQCMKYFSNAEYLKVHIQTTHRYATCEVCGLKQLKKNIKRHLRTHEKRRSDSESVKCSIDRCTRSFSSKSNLQQHVKARHNEARPYVCSFPDCGKAFAYKHVRDNHEKSGCHVYTAGNFEESDEQFRSRPRGGRKRKCPSIESLLRKRVALPQGLEFPAE